MNPILKLRRQCRIDQALAFNPRFSGEGRRHDLNRKMRLATFARTGMTRVAVRVIVYIEPRRGERLGELAAGVVGDGNGGASITMEGAAPGTRPGAARSARSPDPAAHPTHPPGRPPGRAHLP